MRCTFCSHSKTTTQCAALKLCIFKRELKMLALLHLCIFFLLLLFFFLFVNFLNFAKNLSFCFKILWFPKFFDFLNSFQTFVTFARAYSLKSFKLFFPLILYAKIVKQTFPPITRGVFGPAAQYGTYTEVCTNLLSLPHHKRLNNEFSWDSLLEATSGTLLGYNRKLFFFSLALPACLLLQMYMSPFFTIPVPSGLNSLFFAT